MKGKNNYPRIKFSDIRKITVYMTSEFYKTFKIMDKSYLLDDSGYAVVYLPKNPLFTEEMLLTCMKMNNPHSWTVLLTMYV